MVAAEIPAAGERGTAVGGDVADDAAVAALVARTEAAFGTVTLLVNNSGYVHQGRFVDLQPAEWDRMFAVHMRGTFLCTRAVLPGLLARAAAVIVDIASQLGQIRGVELTHHCAAKAAIIGLTKSLAREISKQGVRVNAVAPGPINTPLALSMSEAWRRANAAGLPLGRFGEPEEVAATIAVLASDAASLFVGKALGPNSGDVML